MTEEWREIKGFPGRWVSNLGRVKSDMRGHLKGHTVMRNGEPQR